MQCAKRTTVGVDQEIARRFFFVETFADFNSDSDRLREPVLNSMCARESLTKQHSRILVQHNTRRFDNRIAQTVCIYCLPVEGSFGEKMCSFFNSFSFQIENHVID